MKYIIKFKEYGEKWRTTSYSCQRSITIDYLVAFFALDECEDFIIEEENRDTP